MSLGRRGLTSPRGFGRAAALGLALSLGFTASPGCSAFDQPPDEKPAPREHAAPTLTLGLRDRGAPSASSEPTASSGPIAPTCCEALREEVRLVAIEDESALLFAAIECDRMRAAKAFSLGKLRALLGELPIPKSCL